MQLLHANPNTAIEEVERNLLSQPQVECPLRHLFAPGVYYREVTMPAGTLVIGHEHLTEHFNIVTKGVARVMIDGEFHLIQAPHVFVSKPGVRKVLLIDEDMTWATVHVTTETDLEILESTLIRHSESFDSYHDEIQRLTGEQPCLG